MHIVAVFLTDSFTYLERVLKEYNEQENKRVVTAFHLTGWFKEQMVPLRCNF